MHGGKRTALHSSDMTSTPTAAGHRRARRGGKGVPLTSTQTCQFGELQQQASDLRSGTIPPRQQFTSKLARLTAAVDRYDALQRRLGDATAIDELLSGSADSTSSTSWNRPSRRSRSTGEGGARSASCPGRTRARRDRDRPRRAPAGRSRWIGPTCSFGCTHGGGELHGRVDEVHYGDEPGSSRPPSPCTGRTRRAALGRAWVHRLVRISPFDAQKRRHTSSRRST